MVELNGSQTSELEECDESLLHLVASALFYIAETHERGIAQSAPYPPIVQRALDRLAAVFLLRGHNPPQSLHGLFDLCRQPLVEWPLNLPDACFGSDDSLLDRDRLTNLCDEWALKRVMDVEAELSQQRLIDEVRKTCRNQNRQDTYVEFRKTLIEHPVIEQLELLEKLNSSALQAVRDLVKNCYISAPSCHVDDGQFRCCVVCQGLLQRSNETEFVCENENCRVNGEFATGRRFGSDQGVLWLRREHRRFIAAPGIAELSIYEKLLDLADSDQFEVELWPNFDSYDILVRFENSIVWAIDVKDQKCPYLLGQNARAPISSPPWDRAFFVFPDKRKSRSDYMRAFKNRTQVLGGVVEASFASELIVRVIKESRRKANA